MWKKPWPRATTMLEYFPGKLPVGLAKVVHFLGWKEKVTSEREVRTGSFQIAGFEGMSDT